MPSTLPASPALVHNLYDAHHPWLYELLRRRLNHTWDRLTLGGGVNWQSRFFGRVYPPDPNDAVNDGHDSRIVQDGDFLVDAMAR